MASLMAEIQKGIDSGVAEGFDFEEFLAREMNAEPWPQLTPG